MTFVATGFRGLDNMISGGGDCNGFPRGSITLLMGSVGSGKTQFMTKVCENAHRNKLKVVYVDPEFVVKAPYPVVNSGSMDDLVHLMTRLLHPGKKDKTDLLVIDSMTGFSNPVDHLEGHVANSAQYLNPMLRLDLGQTALVITWQTRRNDNKPPVSIGHRASLILRVSMSGSNFNLELTKSRVSTAGVSCVVDPGEIFDRSKILNRYERILRGRD